MANESENKDRKEEIKHKNEDEKWPKKWEFSGFCLSPKLLLPKQSRLETEVAAARKINYFFAAAARAFQVCVARISLCARANKQTQNQQEDCQYTSDLSWLLKKKKTISLIFALATTTEFRNNSVAQQQAQTPKQEKNENCFE